MDINIFEKFPDRQAFDSYWMEHYVPVVYEDVKNSYEDFVRETKGRIYQSDYEEKNCVSKVDFKENLSGEAKFHFQDGLTEAFYEKNPALYETAFAVYEEAKLSGQGDAAIAQIFHETYAGLYAKFLDQLFDEMLSTETAGGTESEGN